MLLSYHVGEEMSTPLLPLMSAMSLPGAVSPVTSPNVIPGGGYVVLAPSDAHLVLAPLVVVEGVGCPKLVEGLRMPKVPVTPALVDTGNRFPAPPATAYVKVCTTAIAIAPPE